MVDANDQRIAGHVSKGDVRAELDFNAVAQGFTVDGLAEVLMDYGVSDMMVELGGEAGGAMATMSMGAMAHCRRPSPREWPQLASCIGGARPGGVHKWELQEGFRVNGQKLSHTLDPRTGAPVTHGLLSATVVTPSAAYADAYATVCMVLGRTKAHCGWTVCNARAKTSKRCLSWTVGTRATHFGRL